MGAPRITAFGSSFVAGPGLKPRTNYPNLLARSLGAHLTDLSISGSTLDNIDTTPQTRFAKMLPIDRIDPKSTIVTLTAGGNDLGYTLGLTWDSILAGSGWLGGLFGLKQLGPFVDQPELASRWRRVLTTIKSRAPDARVYVVEYPNVFGEQTRSGVDTSLDVDRIRHYIGLSRVMSEAIHTAAADFEYVDVVPMAQMSEGHEVGSAEPWVAGFDLWAYWMGRDAFPLHPNTDGHKAAAAAILSRIEARDIGQT